MARDLRPIGGRVSDRQQDVLRLQPHMIPAVRANFRSALNQVNDTLVDLSRRGFIPEPWLGDETSNEVATYYTQKAMNGPQSSYQFLLEYRDELSRVHDTLQQMEANYRRTEGENAALWGRMA
jgi:hypothetical protein